MAKKKDHTTEQITAFVAELEKQTDRGAALIAGAVLDEVLEMAITARLIDLGRDQHDSLFGRGRPLDSFSAKIGLGYALGLYPNAARVLLEMVRDVRNKFAHRIEPLEFSNPDVVQVIASRRTPRTPKGLPPRQEFLGMFALLAAMLYGIKSIDIRLRPLTETHSDYLSAMQGLTVATQAARQTSSGQPPPKAEPEPSKP